ncbi:MAG TPA: hypothetical protein VK358_14145 [Longimicrobium sp.]|nr:hypothetical protein [Longimicrobium sp.]
MNPRLQVMLDSRQIETVPAEDEEVLGMWAKAARSLHSSGVAGLDPDSVFTLAYQGALQAATAVVRAAGYRVRGDGHHHHTFAAAAALDLGELSVAARDLNVIRQRRHEAIYDWEAVTRDRDLATLRSAAARLFADGRRWIQAQRPHLGLPGASGGTTSRHIIPGPPCIQPAGPCAFPPPARQRRVPFPSA